MGDNFDYYLKTAIDRKKVIGEGIDMLKGLKEGDGKANEIFSDFKDKNPESFKEIAELSNEYEENNAEIRNLIGKIFVDKVVFSGNKKAIIEENGEKIEHLTSIPIEFRKNISFSKGFLYGFVEAINTTFGNPFAFSNVSPSDETEIEVSYGNYKVKNTIRNLYNQLCKSFGHKVGNLAKVKKEIIGFLGEEMITFEDVKHGNKEVSEEGTSMSIDEIKESVIGSFENLSELFCMKTKNAIQFTNARKAQLNSVTIVDFPIGNEKFTGSIVTYYKTIGTIFEIEDSKVHDFVCATIRSIKLRKLFKGKLDKIKLDSSDVSYSRVVSELEKIYSSRLKRIQLNKNIDELKLIYKEIAERLGSSGLNEIDIYCIGLFINGILMQASDEYMISYLEATNANELIGDIINFKLK